MTWHASAQAAVRGADAVVILTEWPEYAALPLHEIAGAMKGNRLFDLRNMLSPAAAEAAGLVYRGIGRAAGPRRERPIEIAAPVNISFRDEVCAPGPLASEAILLPDDGNTIGAQ